MLFAGVGLDAGDGTGDATGDDAGGEGMVAGERGTGETTGGVDGWDGCREFADRSGTEEMEDNEDNSPSSTRCVS